MTESSQWHRRELQLADSPVLGRIIALVGIGQECHFPSNYDDAAEGLRVMGASVTAARIEALRLGLTALDGANLQDHLTGPGRAYLGRVSVELRGQIACFFDDTGPAQA